MVSLCIFGVVQDWYCLTDCLVILCSHASCALASGGGWVSFGRWCMTTLLVKPACLVVRSWSWSRRWARWKCVLKVVQVFSLLGLAFQALQSSKYNPVLKTRVYAMRRSWSAVYGWSPSSAESWPSSSCWTKQWKGCWGPKGHAFWCRCLLIRVV